MTRRRFFVPLGFLTCPTLLVQPAAARMLIRYFAGGMSLAGNSTAVSLKLTTSSGRNRLVTGQIWLNEGAHGISGRFSRDRKRLVLSAGLPNNQELRLDGKCSERGASYVGRAVLFADGSPIAGGSFSLRETSTPPGVN